jgi:hypothetical protein
MTLPRQSEVKEKPLRPTSLKGYYGQRQRQKCKQTSEGNTPDFKREAVNLVETSGIGVPQIARDFGIGNSIPYKWQSNIMGLEISDLR